jgi:hypothetical protein
MKYLWNLPWLLETRASGRCDPQNLLTVADLSLIVIKCCDMVQISLPAAALAPFSSYAIRTAFTKMDLFIPSWEAHKLRTSEVIHEKVELRELLEEKAVLRELLEQVQSSFASDTV